MQKKKILLKTLLLFSIFLQILSQSLQDDVVISKISNDPVENQGNQISSMAGGTIFYIRGSGFDKMLSNNIVFIGSIQATVTGANDAYLMFESPPQQFEVYLPVSVVVVNSQTNSKRYSICRTNCNIYYYWGYTTELRRIAPRSAAPMEYVVFFVYPKTFDNSESIEDMKIGSFVCDRVGLDFVDLNRWSSYNKIYCRVAPEMVSGYYNSSVRVKTYGSASPFSTFATLDNNNYLSDFKCLPIILNISSNMGSPNGQIIEISGYGFSPVLSEVNVQAGDYECRVLYSDLYKIKCEVDNQMLMRKFFHGGAGIERRLFDGSNSNLFNLDGNFQKMIWSKNYTLPLLDYSIYNEMDRILTDDSEELYVLESWEGYFRAPVSGKYRFFLNSDDYSELYLSNVSNSSNSSYLQKIASTTYNTYEAPYVFNSQISDYISLSAGQFYLINAFRNEGNGASHMWVAVEVESKENNAISIVAVEKINITCDAIREIQEIKIYNFDKNNLFKIVLEARDPTTGKQVFYSETKALPYDISAGDLRARVSYDLNWHWPSVARYNLYANGTIILDSKLYQNYTKGYFWQINFTTYRDEYLPQIQPKIKLLNAGDKNPTVIIQNTQKPSPPITGNITLRFNKTYTVSFEGNTSSLYNFMANIPGLDRNFYTERYGYQLDNHYYLIKMVGLAAPVPLFEVISNTLQGGQKQPKVEITKVVEESNNKFYGPIPSEMLYTINDTPQIIVSSRNITSKCHHLTKCDYMINSTITPILQNFTITSSGLDLTLSNYQYLVISSDTLMITFAGNNCSVSSVKLPKISCTISKTSSKQLQLEAGNHFPSIHIQGHGFVSTNISLPSYNVPLNVSSLNKTEGSTQGGQIIKITGNGFPFQNTQEFIVKLGSSDCQVLDVTNTELTIKTPIKNLSSLLEIEYNTLKAKYTGYTYSDNNTPTITSINPNSSSPSQKKDIIITGSKFGTDKNLVKVYLKCAITNENVYELSIVNISDTQIIAVLGGGKNGQYYVVVESNSVGASKESQKNCSLFSYEIIISSISPNQGSIYGGTIITINGSNFSPINNQNQVFIGEEVNSFCDIIESSTDYIKCKTRALNNENLINKQQKVIVTQRVQEVAICNATNCNFVYKKTISPIIYVPNPMIVAKAGETVQLNGENLQPESKNQVIISFISGMNINDNSTFAMNLLIQAIYASTSVIKFIMPALPQASYSISIYIGNKGHALINGSLSLISPLEVYNLTINDGLLDNNNGIISRGGARLNITGNGFNGESVYIDNSGFCSILSNSTTWIYCINRQIWDSSKQYSVSVYRDSKNKYTCSNCYIFVNDSKTLYLQSHTAFNQEMPCNFTLTAFGKNFNISSSVKAFLEIFDNAFQYVLKRYEGTVSNITNNNLSISFINIPNNTYRLNIYYENLGYVFMDEKWKSIQVSAFNISLQQNITNSSYFGGKVLSLQGDGFPDMSDLSNNNITICGYLCEIISFDVYNIQCRIPKMLNLESINYYNLSSSESTIQTPDKIYSDNSKKQIYINDNLLSTYYDSTNSYCYVTFEFLDGFLVQLKEVQYYPSTTKTIDNYYGLIFEGSNNNINFSKLFTLDENIKTGWNSWTADNTVLPYRFYRFSTPTSNHKSRCNIAEVKLIGLKYYTKTNNLEMSECDTVLNIYGYNFLFNKNIQYRKDQTPIVSSISPNIGPTSGGTTITINGDNFGTKINSVNVTIDGVQCNISSVTNQKIMCKTNPRLVFVPSSFQVTINNNTAIQSDSAIFSYIDRWSDPNTWGGEAPPRAGDSVYIPKGQIVLLDVSTPELDAVIIEGTLIFEDKDKTFDAHYLVCMQGKVEIGTQNQPFTSKLTITMHGQKKDKQLPEFGNKVWAFHQGILDMHGKPKNITWTLLGKTAEIGDQTITLQDAVDWSANDWIVIASTDFNHNNSETRKITKISSDRRTLTLDSPITHRHYSAIETYGAYSIPIQAEVGLLTRNILFQGDPSEETKNEFYGAHLMLHSRGSIARISYTEFCHVGQGRIIGRYPIHFHRVEDASESFVVGNAVHESFARVVAIHGTNFLRVQKNVGYRVYGHNYFIEDGVETNNLLEDNLGVSTIQIWTLINTDVTAATFWITNPNNIVRRNRAAGGDWFGFWYQLENRATGPSSNPDICPDGIPLGLFKDNVAHSYNAFGLRIYEYIPRQFPCEVYSDFDTNDWFEKNPPVPAVFENFLAFKNFENGLMAEHIGSVEFRNFIIVDSRLSGIQISQTNFTRQDEAKVNGAVIIGVSIGNADNDTTRYNNSVGFTTPRTDNLLINNVSFYNFKSSYNMSAFKSCSKCWHFKLKITGGKTTKFSKLSFTNVDRRIIWDGTKKEVYIDLDGSFFGIKANASITAYYPHLDGISECFIANSSIYDDSIICNSNVRIRPIMFRNLRPQEAFRALEIKAYRIPDYNFNLSLSDPLNFTRVVMYKIFVDTPYTWDLPFVTGYSYNIHWQDGSLDFTHMNIYPTNYWSPDDKGVVLRFNYSEIREDFNISVWKFNNEMKPVNKKTDLLDPVTNNYNNADYYHIIDKKYFYIGINGKINGTIEVDPIKCLKTCPVIDDDVNKESFFRLWSNVSMWNNSKLPQKGENVIIPSAWRVILDIDTPNLSSLIIDGDLTFDTTQDKITLTAALIWVRKGSIYAGSIETPYPKKIEIKLTGTRASPSLIIDSFIDSANKILAVTGNMKLYGKGTNKTWTHLAKSVNNGENVIVLSEAVDWAAGNIVVIGPTETDNTHHEKFTILQISDDKKTITLNEKLQYFHYGSENTTYNSEFGSVLDMRAAVGLLDRNIVITSDGDDNWGGNVLVYQFTDNLDLVRRGYIELDNVEISLGGHPDTERASLDMKYLQADGYGSIIQRSSIHDGFGWCINAQSSSNITIKNNVFYNCEKFLTRALYANNFRYLENLLIAARKRNLNEDSHLYDMVAGLDMYQPVKNGQIFIMNNVVQGIQGNGYVIASTACGDTSGFQNNHVNSVEWIGLIMYLNNSQCIKASNLTISRSHIGILTNVDAAGLSLNNIILAENDIGLKVMYGREADENQFSFKNIVFNGLARTDCVFCYQKKDYCSNFIGMYIPITVISGKTIPIDKPTPDGMTSICKDASFDQKLMLQSVTFINFKLDYSNDTNKNYHACSNNNMIQMRFGEPDASAPIYLSQSKVINSDIEAFFRLTDPNPEFLFWRGGCGDFNCTGEKNWLFTDIDGSFFDKPSQVIPNNLGITYPCKGFEQWNGRLCEGIHFGMLEFQNDGVDQRKRIVAPVNITSKYMKNTLNQWREWKWEGPEPLDQRLARFNGIIELNTTIKMEFETVVPEELKIQLQKGRGGFDYLIVSIIYERPNTVEVWNYNTKSLIKSYRNDQNIDLTAKIMECGANIYDPEKRMITFVINNLDDCLLKVRTISSVKVSLHMETTVENFYKNDGEADFISKISSFLGFDMSRIRIVNVRTGSVIVDFVVIENKTLSNSTSAVETDAIDDKDINQTNQTLIDEFNKMKSDLEKTAEKLKLGINSGDLALNAKVLDVTTEVVVNNLTIYTNDDENKTDNSSNNNDTNNNQDKNNTDNETNNNHDTNINRSSSDDSNVTIIIVASISGALVVIFVIVVCCCVKNKEGIAMVLLAREYLSSSNRKNESSFNQELMASKGKWNDPEEPNSERNSNIFIHGKIDNYTQKYLQNQ